MPTIEECLSLIDEVKALLARSPGARVAPDRVCKMLGGSPSPHDALAVLSRMLTTLRNAEFRTQVEKWIEAIEKLKTIENLYLLDVLEDEYKKLLDDRLRFLKHLLSKCEHREYFIKNEKPDWDYDLETHFEDLQKIENSYFEISKKIFLDAMPPSVKNKNNDNGDYPPDDYEQPGL